MPDDMEDYLPQYAYDGGSVVQDKNTMNKLKPGDELNITKKDPTIKAVVAGMGWDFRSFDADPPDLDVCVFLLDKNGQTRVDEDFIFYNNKMGGEGSVMHLGDSRTGAGDGDDEQIELNLATLPFEIVKIVFVLSLYNLDVGQESLDFSMVRNVYFRLFNQETDFELFRLHVDEAAIGTDSTSVIFGELDRIGSEWLFTAHVEPVKGGLAKIAADYGILVMQNVQA